MTSNLGTDFARQGGTLGFAPNADAETVSDHKKIEKALKETFRPEFINRVDEIIIFSPLTVDELDELQQHAEHLHLSGDASQLHEIQDRMSEQGLTVELTDASRAWLARQGYDPAFGARPLRRALQKYVESPLSVQLLRGDFPEGSQVIVDATPEEGIVFRTAGIPADIDVDHDVYAE